MVGKNKKATKSKIGIFLWFAIIFSTIIIFHKSHDELKTFSNSINQSQELGEGIPDEKLPDEKLPDEKLSDEKLSDEKLSDEKLRDEKLSSLAKSPLNIVIFYPDDWRHNDIGGVAPIVRTPFLNSLAKMGIRFTHNAVTTSICWVSRATLFTGQYVSRHASTYLFKPIFAVYNWNTTWPYLLQQHGYYVGHVGKWQYHDVNSYMSRIFDFTRYHEGHHWYDFSKYGRNVQQTATDRARDDVFDFLDERPKDKPFAVTVAYYPPKAVGENLNGPGQQWKPHEEFQRLYENDTIPFPYDAEKAYKSLPKFLQNDQYMGKQRWKNRWRTPSHYQTGMKNYYSLISQVDATCEEIFNRLKRLNLLETTMIIFTTDNGLMHGAHGLAGKWIPYEESIRVPLIIYDPRMPHDKRGTLDDSLTLNVDLAETILGAAGIDPAPLMQGRDIADLYLRPPEKNMSAPWRDEFFYEYPLGTGTPKDPRATALVRKDWKYISWSEHDYDELFHTKEDPYELHDILHNPAKEPNTGNKSLQDNVTNEIDTEELLKEMKARHDQLRVEVMSPIIPGSVCDPLWVKNIPIPYNAPECPNITVPFYDLTQDAKMMDKVKQRRQNEKLKIQKGTI